MLWVVNFQAHDGRAGFLGTHGRQSKAEHTVIPARRGLFSCSIIPFLDSIIATCADHASGRGLLSRGLTDYRILIIVRSHVASWPVLLTCRQSLLTVSIGKGDLASRIPWTAASKPET